VMSIDPDDDDDVDDVEGEARFMSLVERLESARNAWAALPGPCSLMMPSEEMHVDGCTKT